MLADRLATISELLRERGRLSIDEIVQELQVSPATARRYLSRLEGHGTLVRTYGGCVLRDSVPRVTTSAEDDGVARTKREIGRKTAELIDDGETVIVSSGTTTSEVARHLASSGKRLTVITNALDVANLLVDVPLVELMVLGGIVRSQMHSMLGHLAELSAKQVRADRLVMGVPGIHVDKGLTSNHLPEVITDRSLVAAAAEVTVVADSSKFGRVKPAFLLSLHEVSTIVTDDALSEDDADAVRMKGPQVVRVSVSNRENERGIL